MKWNFSQEVTKELSELKKVGVRVPKKAFDMAKDESKMKEYENMKIGECADLLIMLAL